jgi:hypothetical protein
MYVKANKKYKADIKLLHDLADDVSDFHVVVVQVGADILAGRQEKEEWRTM